MSTNTWQDWLGVQTVTGLVRQTGSHNLFLDGAPLYSFSRRQSVIATSFGMAEFYAGCATAEAMLPRCANVLRLSS